MSVINISLQPLPDMRLTCPQGGVTQPSGKPHWHGTQIHCSPRRNNTLSPQSLQVVLVTPAGTDFGPLDTALSKQYLPNRAIARLNAQQVVAQESILPLIMGKVAMKGQTTAYVCEEGRCEQPTSDPKVLARQLLKHRPLFDDQTAPPLPRRGRR